MMESYSCESCSVKFVSQLKLKKHIKRIHDNRVFVCEYCNNEIIGQTKLSNHLKIHKSTICKKCGLAVPKNSITVHKAKCSTEDLVFACEECPYFSNRKGNLKQHKMTQHTHATVKQTIVHECKECNEKFAMKKHLNKHTPERYLKQIVSD